MRFFLKCTLILFLLIIPSAYSVDIVLPIIKATDGDTIRTSLPLPCPLCNMYVRILGIDAPERGAKAKCSEEAIAGAAAKAALIKLIGSNKTMTVKNVKWDKYGGRMNGDVIINDINVATYMIQNKFVAPYTGVGPKPNWCVPITQ